MLSFEKALMIVLSKAKQLPQERVSLSQSLGRILATDIPSDIDMPPHDLSAMDGYACRAIDRDRPLHVIETIPAGKMPQKTIQTGQCARIMTGAVVPRGADMVVMFEDTNLNDKDGSVEVSTKRDNPNIRRRGEDVRRGDIVLRKGTVIMPSTVAVFAAVGRPKVQVFRQPRIGIIATGDELVEPDKRPRNGQIRNSNGWQLAAQVKESGGIPIYYGIVNDDPAALDRIIKKSLHDCDSIMLSGGVSMGDFDFVPDVFKKNKIRLLFENIAIKPGRPMVFGMSKNKCVFGVPGNPVSAFVVFEMLIKPFLYRMAGHHYARRIVSCALTETITRRNGSRLEFRPIKFSPDGSITLPDYHGSAHIHAYAKTDGIMVIPAGVTMIKSGTMVQVVLL